MTTLTLNLKAEYFNAIKDGTKVEEFRLRNAHWRKRLEGRTFDGVVLLLGYPAADNGSWRARENLTIAQAARRLQEELERMAVKRGCIILSTDLRLNLDGSVRSSQAQPRDPGAAVYWKDAFTGQDRCMAIDIYTKVEQNIAALAATIDALRAIERHGGAAILDRAFTGFTALPAPIVAGMARPWWEVLGVPSTASRDEIQQAYRRLASEAHPDKGGTAERMAEINRARDEGLAS